MELTDEECRLLDVVIQHFDKEDRAVRERQLRTWRRLKLFWDGFQRVWYSETAHDWRVWDEQRVDVTDQSFYEKPVNIFRAYLESIIAALSTTVPPIKCYPDDADNPLDLSTAKAGDKIAKLVYRHNNVTLLWLHALFIYCTEGLIGCYSYPKEDDSFGTYEQKEYEDVTEMHQVESCPLCGTQLSDVVLVDREKDEFQPDDTDAPLHNLLINDHMELCPNCMLEVDPEMRQEPLVVTRLAGVTRKAKSRQCLEVYGGLYIKVANYAKNQSETPYLRLSYETHYSQARDKYPDIYDKIGPGKGSGYEPYERWARLSPQYYSEYPLNNVTMNYWWLRASAFDILEKDESKKLRKKFPDGCKVVKVNDVFAEAENESLDDCWTLSYNPLSDYIYYDPLGVILTPLQELTNDLMSLTIQTIEHGIGQTFVDPNVLNFDAYRQTETVPGMIFPITAKSGKPVADSFFEVKTANLSGEVLPFIQQVQTFGQLVSGALPSLFGGQLQDNKTASAYSMSRSQALQRLQNTWKMLTMWWEEIFAKVIPAYIKTVEEDERYVEKSDTGDFINVLIRKSELEGKIGNVELEANENLPITWNQMRDVVMQLVQANNPQILQLLATPENLPLIYEAIGLTDLNVPGEDSRNKQYDEIKQLLQSEPLTVPPGPMETQMAVQSGEQPQVQEYASVDVDPIMDNHQVEFDICKTWANSEAGRLAKIENSAGYKNVLIHAKEHYQFMMQAMMPPPPAAGQKGVGSPSPDNAAPVKGDNNVDSAA